MEALIAAAITGLIGLAGILATWATSRRQAETQLTLLHEQQREDLQRELRTAQSVAYGQLLAELTEIEAHGDYFERLHRGFTARNHELQNKLLEYIPDEESAARLARDLTPRSLASRIVGDFDDAGHFRDIHQRAAQVSLVASDSVSSCLPPVMSAAMRVVASIISTDDDSDRLAEDLNKLRRAKAALLRAMGSDLNGNGLHEIQSSRGRRGGTTLSKRPTKGTG